MRRKNDILWKGILEEVFADLLRFVFPDVDKELDLQRGFEFLDKELGEMYPQPEKASQTRFVDKLVKVYLRDGGERWMLLHKITDKNYTMGIIEQVAEMRAAEGMRKGLKKGEKMATRLIVENLLKDSNFSLQKIASLANITVDFVKKVKKELNSK